jgi:hypothetical protein
MHQLYILSKNQNSLTPFIGAAIRSDTSRIEHHPPRAEMRMLRSLQYALITGLVQFSSVLVLIQKYGPLQTVHIEIQIVLIPLRAFEFFVHTRGVRRLLFGRWPQTIGRMFEERRGG